MSEYMIQGETLTAIADAIRSKTETTDSLTPMEMVAAIENLSSSSPVCTVSIDSVVGITSVSYTNGSDNVTTLSLADGQKTVDLYDVKQGSLMFFGLESDRYCLIEERTDTNYVISDGAAFHPGSSSINGTLYVDELLVAGDTYLGYIDGTWYEEIGKENTTTDGIAYVSLGGGSDDAFSIIHDINNIDGDGPYELYLKIHNSEETTHTFALAKLLKLYSTGATLMPESDGKSYAVSVGNGNATISITH